MPLRKEPKLLNEAALQHVCNIIDGKFIAILNGLTTRVWLRGCYAFYKEQIEPLSRILFESLPVGLANELHDLIFDRASKLNNPTNEETKKIISTMCGKFKRNLKLIPYITLASIHPYVTEIHSIQFPFETLEILFSILPRLINLRILKFTTWYSLWPSLVFNVIYSMKELRILHIFYICTDELMKNLIKYCPKLMELDVMYSWHVTDTSARYVKRLPNLQSFGCIDTSITYGGLLQIIDVVDVKFGDMFHFKSILQTMKDRKTLKYLKLRYTKLRFPRMEELTFIKQYCADMVYIELVEGIHENFNFIDLPSVKKFKLKMDMPMTMKIITSVFEIQGKNLSYLTLNLLSGINAGTLSIISDLCPNLIDLKLISCELDDTSTPNDHSQNKFANLEVVECNTFIPKACVIVLLSRCSNITKIHFTKGSDIDDDGLFDVMDTNPLLQLTDFFLTHCACTSASLFQLFYRCYSLRRLRDISTWWNVHPEEVIGFRTYLRICNYALELDLD